MVMAKILTGLVGMDTFLFAESYRARTLGISSQLVAVVLDRIVDVQESY